MLQTMVPICTTRISIVIPLMAPDLPFAPFNNGSFPSVEYVSFLKINRAGSVDKMLVNHDSVGNTSLSVTIRHISAPFFFRKP